MVEVIEKFILDLEKPSVAKILRGIDLLETYGSKIGMPWVKYISVGLFELRVKGKQEIRIFFYEKGGVIVLLSIYKKQSNKVPAKELEKARDRLARI